MAAPLKEKNMPTISSNLYGGLQKWVNRASVSIRGRRRSRTNSISSAMTSYQQNHLENISKGTGSNSGIIPSHGRSRSNPVPMPDSLIFGTEHQKIPPVIKPAKNGRIRKTSFELSDDSSSRGSLHDAKDLSVLNTRLTNTLSKSESNLLDGQRYSGRSKSLTTTSVNRRRKSTANSLDSNSSDIDTNDGHKISQSSQSLSKTNKRDKRHSVDFTRTNKTEQSSYNTKNTEVMSNNILSRLDTWLEKTTGFQDSRQSSFDSTSSSEDIFYDNNNKARKNDTKHFRDLQTALDELVSSCGKTSARNSIIAVNTDEHKNKRKISLKNTGAVFNKAVEIESICLQEQRRKVYTTKKCGSSSESGSSRGKDHDERQEIKEETYREEEKNDLESSYDSVDGFIDGRDDFHEIDSSKDFESDIGPIGANTRVMNNITTDHASNQPQTTSTTKTINLPNLTLANEHMSDHESPSYLGPSSNDSPQASKETKFNFENKDKVLPKPTRSPKNHRAPSPPGKLSTKKASTISANSVFDDEELVEFALQCVKASEKSSNSLERDERRNRSDSDEEKKTALALDYVYIPKTKNVKSSTHPQTTFDEKGLPQEACSDDECYPTKFVEKKRNSADSLDGLVVEIDFENDTGSKYHSSNENDNTKDNDKTDDQGYGSLRKFPSMPLFYVPNDGSRKSSRGKSFWKKLKSLPRATENRTPTQPKAKHSHIISSDPFYHGEHDQEIVPDTRPKSHSMAVAPREAVKQRLRRRQSLEPATMSTSLPTVPVSKLLENGVENTDKVIATVPLQEESQC